MSTEPMQLVPVPEETGDYARMFISKPYGDWKYDVRADGCVHIKRFFNGSTEDVLGNPDMCYLHVCELEEFIATLTKLAEETKEFRESY